MTILQLPQAKLIRDDYTTKEATHHDTRVQWYTKFKAYYQSVIEYKGNKYTFFWLNNISPYILLFQWNKIFTSQESKCSCVKF